MTRQKWILLIVALVLIGSTAAVLAHVKNFQTLGAPGVKTAPLPDSQNLEVLLPADVPGYACKKLATDPEVLKVLPKDTSFGSCVYAAPNGFWDQTQVVLMGSDRTSIHKPQFCLGGSGWKITSTGKDAIPLAGNPSYNLPVIKLTTTKTVGDKTWNGFYVYWYVADHAVSNDAVGLQRLGESAWKLLHTGVLQRWAYVSYFAACQPGQEDATYAQLKQLIAASVPQFQLAVPDAAAQAPAP